MSKLLFLGDFIYDYDGINDDIIYIGDFIKSNEYSVILNLEGPLKSDKPIKKWINLYNSNILVEVLKMINVKSVNIANNHINDWGNEGLNRLLELLLHENIGFFGAGTKIENAINPDILQIGPKKIGLLGFGWIVEQCIIAQAGNSGVAPLDTKLILTRIEQIRPTVDLLIINFHWGYEYDRYPLPVHRELAHKCIEKGVDLIIGHHPHIIQAYEKYNGKYIFYSLGNFYFGKMRHRFYFNKNPFIRDNSPIGLGITYDMDIDEISKILFYSNSESTSITEIDYYIPDISNIDIKSYNRFYKKNRTSWCKRPNLYTGRLNSYLNPIKLVISDIIISLIKLMIVFLKKIRIYHFLKG